MKIKRLHQIIIFVFLGMFIANINLKAGYDPTKGRFITRDPLDEKGAQLLYGIKSDGIKGSVEPYTFVKNNPINLWDLLGLMWKIKRYPEFSWAQVLRTNMHYDSLERLTAIIGLNPKEAFGKNGWLKKRKGSLKNLSDIKDKKEFKKLCHFAIPNNFVVRLGEKASLAVTTGLVKGVLTRKGFRTVPQVTGPDVYGVMYLGHFYGGFSPAGTPANSIGYDHITTNVGHKIAFFAGFGCNSGHHPWEKAIAYPKNKATLWLTNAKFRTVWDDDGLSTHPIRTQDDIDLKKKASQGPTLNKWLTKIPGSRK